MANNNIITRGQELLKKKLFNMSQDTQAAFESGAAQFIDGVYFKRAEVTGKSSLVDLLLNGDDRKDGYTNISKQRINQGENIAVERIGVQVASIVADTFTAGTATYTDVKTSTDGALKNAEIELLIKQKKVVRIPLSHFNEEIKAGSSAMWFTLDAPKLITDQDEIQLRLYVPEGANIDSTASKKSFIEISLAGPVLNANI